jgi:hypothetical protein
LLRLSSGRAPSRLSVRSAALRAPPLLVSMSTQESESRPCSPPAVENLRSRVAGQPLRALERDERDAAVARGQTGLQQADHLRGEGLHVAADERARLGCEDAVLPWWLRERVLDGLAAAASELDLDDTAADSTYSRLRALNRRRRPCTCAR